MTEKQWPYRLIGPFQNRLLTAIDVDNRIPGQISHDAAASLLKHGWSRYTGPAREDAGWIIKDSDPALKPRRVQIS